MRKDKRERETKCVCVCVCVCWLYAAVCLYIKSLRIVVKNRANLV